MRLFEARTGLPRSEAKLLLSGISVGAFLLVAQNFRAKGDENFASANRTPTPILKKMPEIKIKIIPQESSIHYSMPLLK